MSGPGPATQPPQPARPPAPSPSDWVPEPAPRRHTSTALSAGVVAAATCFAVALAAEFVGRDVGGGEMTDLATVVEGLLALTPWAWATLGVYVVVVTPAVGLVVTAWEYASVGDRRTLLLAAAVIAVLAASAVIAILR